MTSQEAGYLCLLSTLLGGHGQIYVPKEGDHMNLIDFQIILERFLDKQNLRPVYLGSESEARSYFGTNAEEGKWPCLLFSSDTSGEKLYEEFYTHSEEVEFNTYNDIAVVQHSTTTYDNVLQDFTDAYLEFKNRSDWKKSDLVNIIKTALPELKHVEKTKNLNQRM